MSNTIIKNQDASISLVVAANGAPVPVSGAVAASLLSVDGLPTGAAVTAALGSAPGSVTVTIAGAVTAALAVGEHLLRVSGAFGSRLFEVQVEDADTIVRSDLFIRDVVIAKLRRDRLALAAAGAMPDVALSDDFLWDKLLAAEAEVRHTLRVPLRAARFFPRQPTPEQLEPLPVGTPWDLDPAYDYNPDNFSGDKWGYIVTRQKPVQSIVGMKFVYPSPQQTIVDVPADWIRADLRYGHVQLVPTGTAYQTLLGGLFMSSLSGGKTLPFTVDLDYIAGLSNVATEYPDLIDAVIKLAVVKIVEDGFMPQSGSISADGLSQSMSVDAAKYRDAVDAIMNGSGSNGGLVARIHGIRMMVM
jgi:hypothetical protein